MQRSSFFVFLAVFAILLGFANTAEAQQSATPIRPSADACLPFDMLNREQIFASPHRVFAHYFDRFPSSMDNKPAAIDYYSRNYLRPEGENNKWLGHGGYLRVRPVPVPVVALGHDYKVENMARDVRRALARGIGGFTYDVLTPQDAAPGNNLDLMLAAATSVDPRFKIVLMPDMASLKGGVDTVEAMIRIVHDKPGLLHVSGNRLVVAPFLAESILADEWARMEKELQAQGMPVAFFPTFLSLKPEYALRYTSVSEGMGTFGTPSANQGLILQADSQATHALGKVFMAGLSAQGYRPKDFVFWEAAGSQAYRSGWTGAINGNADWIQLTTWNDYSETTQIAPYTSLTGDAGTGYYDLTGYYAAWFLTGTQPRITHDVLYYFYRKEASAAPSVNAEKPTVPANNTDSAQDVIELVAFLTAPGRLAVTINGQTVNSDVQGGLQSLTVPLARGVPMFSLSRNGQTIISFNGVTSIAGAQGLDNGYADLTYWTGSASANGTCFADAILPQ